MNQRKIGEEKQEQSIKRATDKGGKMEFPVRCFSCGKVIGHLWEKYKKKVNEKESPEKVLNELGLERYCCRRMFISHVELVEDIIPYQRF